MALLKKHPGTPQHQVAKDPAEISMKSEFIRKGIHLCSIGIPVLYILLNRTIMLWLLVPFTIIAFAVEIVRLKVPSVELSLRKIFGPIMREHEKAGGKAKISGASWVFLSAALCIFIFPKIIAVTGFSVLIVSDTAAALFGRRFGRHRFLEKSVEGSGAFVVTAIIVVALTMTIFHAPWQFLAVGALAAVTAAIAEAMSYGVNVDDNLTIPTSFGIVMWGVLALIGGPEIERLWALGPGLW